MTPAERKRKKKLISPFILYMFVYQAEMEGRVQGMHAVQALKAVVPGFENAKLRQRLQMKAFAF